MRVPSVSFGGVPTRPSDTAAATRHIGSMKQPGLAWVARQMRRQAASAAAPESRPSRVLPVPPRCEPHDGNEFEGDKKESSDVTSYDYSSGALGFTNAAQESRGEHQPVAHAIRHDPHVQCRDDRPGVGQDDRVDIPSSRQRGSGYSDESNGLVGSETESRVEHFGSMAPCWRLIESAQTYMDKDQLQYMRALILAHVRKPMSRDQLLERAEGCLQEQDKIFAAFVKMFDLIDRPPGAPLYPTKGILHPHPPSASYSGRRSPGTNPIHGSLHGVPPSQLPPRTVYQYGEDPYSLCPVDDSGQRGVPTILPCGCTGKWPPGRPSTNPSY